MSINIGIIGLGLVGSEFITQLAEYLSKNIKPTFSVVALKNSKKQLLSDDKYAPLNLTTWKVDLENKGESSNLESFLDYLSSNSLPTVLVDNTSSQEIANKYPYFLKKGLHIITPNKKPFSSDTALFKEIIKVSEETKKFVYNESTVGAGLPIISTIKDLIRTNDKILKIEGIFSGTLSYIFNEFSKSGNDEVLKKFSDIVKIAKENGYTEPDPRDDLNGLDVARKVIILGRFCGLVDLSLETLSVENIVPEPLQKVITTDEFLEKLPEFDQHFTDLNNSSNSKNQVLRYVGLIDFNKNQSCVKLLSLPSTHPFSSLKGSDNIIAITTKRFTNPLIIQGAGAGASVTAFGYKSLSIMDLSIID
ncbi:13174_t:CDS:2 [Entrophospora sp. SA101]|nr:13174_t:CDS:2 [Entrophospora sp. SA101]